MTKKLYLHDSYITTCAAIVLDCRPVASGGFDIVLDSTVLYPTGGGQPHDTGLIGGIRVTGVEEDDELVLHHTSAPLEVGQTVSVQVDWPRRFDHMQQHAGEHLLSYAAKELFGASNVGFHMAAAYCSIDLDIPLSPTELHALENRTNELIQKNMPVELRYVEAEELPNLALRKAAKGLSGTARIVYMPGGDSCTCCGTHVQNTGEIGVLKITSSEHYKGGERIAFSCGMRAVHHAQVLQGITDQLARGYSCKTEDVPAAAEKTQQELFAAKRELKSLYTRLQAYIITELLAHAVDCRGIKLVVRLVDLPAAQLRPLALSLSEGNVRACALLLTREQENVQYVLSCPKDMQPDAGELIQAVNAALNGRGGGRGTLAQGSAKYAPGLDETITQMQDYIVRRLKNEKK